MKIRVTIDMDVEMSGEPQSRAWVRDAVIAAVDEAVPCVLVDSNDADCLLLASSWVTTVAFPRT